MIPYAAEDATFIAALKGACEPDPEFAAGVAAQRIVEAAYESARSGVPVQVKKLKRYFKRGCIPIHDRF